MLLTLGLLNLAVNKPVQVCDESLFWYIQTISECLLVTDGQDGNEFQLLKNYNWRKLGQLFEVLSAVFKSNRLDGQIVWRFGPTDVNSRRPTPLTFTETIAPFASSIPPWRANRHFVRLSPSECEFRSDLGRLVRLDGQLVFTDGQTDDDEVVRRFVRPVFSSDDLSVRTICSSSSACENGHRCVSKNLTKRIVVCSPWIITHAR